MRAMSSRGTVSGIWLMRRAVTKLSSAVHRIGKLLLSAGKANSMTCGVITESWVSRMPASSIPRLAASAQARMMSSRSPEVMTSFPGRKRETKSATERAAITVSRTRRVASSPCITTLAFRRCATSCMRGARSKGFSCTTPHSRVAPNWRLAVALSKSSGARLMMTPATLHPSLANWRMLRRKSPTAFGNEPSATTMTSAFRLRAISALSCDENGCAASICSPSMTSTSASLPAFMHRSTICSSNSLAWLAAIRSAVSCKDKGSGTGI